VGGTDDENGLGAGWDGIKGKVLRVWREVGGLGEYVRGDKTVVAKRRGALTTVPPRMSLISPIEPFKERSSAPFLGMWF